MTCRGLEDLPKELSSAGFEVNTRLALLTQTETALLTCPKHLSLSLSLGLSSTLGLPQMHAGAATGAVTRPQRTRSFWRHTHTHVRLQVCHTTTGRRLNWVEGRLETIQRAQRKSSRLVTISDNGTSVMARRTFSHHLLLVESEGHPCKPCKLKSSSQVSGSLPT